MEDLIELVAASFARHGIECPAGDSTLPFVQPASPIPTAASQIEATALPEHSFRKKPELGPAT